MKNYISYFYNINVDSICFVNQKYIFNSGGVTYILERCKERNIEFYYIELEQQLEQYKLFFKLVPNRHNRLITTIDNSAYILLRVGNVVDDTISLIDLSHPLYVRNTEKLSSLIHFPWYKFWEQKIDYMEEWYRSKKEKYKALYPWINYFIGLGENALMYIKLVEPDRVMQSCDKLSIQHKRVDKNTKKYDYYDPTNIIIDHSSRDIAEYVKANILQETFDLMAFETCLSNINISIYWIKMLYGRILFPSFFFDYMEKIMSDDNVKIKNTEIEKMIFNIEKALKEISLLLNQKYNIPIINWIKKT